MWDIDHTSNSQQIVQCFELSIKLCHNGVSFVNILEKNGSVLTRFFTFHFIIFYNLCNFGFSSLLFV